MKKVISLATALTFMATLALAQQGPTPAKPVAKEGAKKECSSSHKSCCSAKGTAAAGKTEKKGCCAKKGEASTTKTSTNTANK